MFGFLNWTPLLYLLALLGLQGLFGCAQNTNPDFGQLEAQQLQTRQDQVAQGGDRAIIIVANDPNEDFVRQALGGANIELVSGLSEGEINAVVDSATSDKDGNNIGHAKASKQQSGFTIVVSMGGSGTTPSVAGTVTGSQAATGTQTTTARQDPRADVSVALPVAVGAQPNATANVAGRGGTATQEVSAQQELRQAMIRAQKDLSADELQALLRSIFGGDETNEQEEPEEDQEEEAEEAEGG